MDVEPSPPRSSQSSTPSVLEAVEPSERRIHAWCEPEARTVKVAKKKKKVSIEEAEGWDFYLGSAGVN